MNYRRLFLQFPKWAIASSIFGISTTLFLVWWFVRDPIAEEPSQENLAHQQSTDSSSSPPIESAPLNLTGKTLLLGDRNLYEFREGALHLLKEEWLSSSLGQFEQAILLEESKVLIIGGSSSKVSVYNLSGSKIGNLSLTSGGSFDGYIADDSSIAVYAKDGDLWRGDIDWPNAKVVNETQATNLGYIQGRPLKGRLLGASSKGLVYRDNRLGSIGINLETGASQQIRFPANASRSPSGKLIVGDTPTRPAQFVVFDVSNSEHNSHPIPWRIQQNGLVWLSETKAALILNDQIQLYNHEEKSLTLVYQTEHSQGRLTLVAIPIQGHPFLMIQDPNKGILNLNVDTKEFHLVSGPPTNNVQMLNDGAFLLSSDVANSEQRGTWLGKFGEENLRRVFAQPIANQNGISRSGPTSAFSIPETEYALITAFGGWQILNTITGDIIDVNSSINHFRIIQS